MSTSKLSFTWVLSHKAMSRSSKTYFSSNPDTNSYLRCHCLTLSRLGGTFILGPNLALVPLMFKAGNFLDETGALLLVVLCPLINASVDQLPL